MNSTLLLGVQRTVLLFCSSNTAGEDLPRDHKGIGGTHAGRSSKNSNRGCTNWIGQVPALAVEVVTAEGQVPTHCVHWHTLEMSATALRHTWSHIWLTARHPV